MKNTIKEIIEKKEEERKKSKFIQGCKHVGKKVLDGAAAGFGAVLGILIAAAVLKSGMPQGEAIAKAED